MIAVDTNILARLYVDDPADPEARSQQVIAAELFRTSDAIFVPVTVTLELEWVVRAFYDLPVADFDRLIAHLAALPNVVVEDREQVLEALALARGGLGFADALHLTRSRHCERFATFDDRGFARRASAAGAPIPVVVAR
ncbi:MAG: type II toxin-antitoxin system VapC family toxin [Deltaproteobacteria bacterium]|nr:type II toxin-antitoxin system VapC family toxin [Deltaproteobacteria bacterium]